MESSSSCRTLSHLPWCRRHGSPRATTPHRPGHGIKGARRSVKRKPPPRSQLFYSKHSSRGRCPAEPPFMRLSRPGNILFRRGDVVLVTIGSPDANLGRVILDMIMQPVDL